MPGKKITQLPFAFAAALTDILPEVQGGTTKQVNLQQISNLFGFSTGILTPTYGGTGVSDPTAHTIPIAEGSANFNFVGPLTNGQLLIGSTGVDPVAASITAGTGITVTPGAGAITIAATGGSVGAGTINDLAYYAATGSAVSALPTANNGTLITSGAGVPSISSTLPSAVQTNITALGAQAQALNMNTHLINNVVDPVSAQDAATKNYVDQTSLNGTSVYAASAATLGTVTQAGAGVGATLTNAGVQATFALDGVNPPVGTNVLIKNTATGMTAANEGIYTVTSVGSGATNWVLTRATSYDTAVEINQTGLILIQNGSTLAGTAWYNAATIVTVDTTAFSYTQFGNVIFPISLAQGGTSASLTANNGGIFYSTATAGAILAGTATAGKVLQSGATAAPSWSTPTYPSASGTTGQIIRSNGTNNVYSTSTFADTYAVSTLLYASSANVVAGLATVNSAGLLTSAGGVPGWVAYTGTGAPVLNTFPSIISGVRDVNAAVMLGFNPSASAVNYVQIQNAATGNMPSVAFTGSDANVTGNIFVNGTGGVNIQGVTSGAAGTAGFVGESITSQVVEGSAVSMPTGTTTNITSISLTAGCWLVLGNANVNPAGSAAGEAVQFAINNTSATLPVTAFNTRILCAPTSSNAVGGPVPMRIFNLSATTTIYLMGNSSHTTGTSVGYGNITGIRIR